MALPDSRQAPTLNLGSKTFSHTAHAGDFKNIVPISRDEELLFNYGFDLDNWEDHPCICGAPCCPGYMAARNFWPELEARKAERKLIEQAKTDKVLLP